MLRLCVMTDALSRPHSRVFDRVVSDFYQQSQNVEVCISHKARARFSWPFFAGEWKSGN